MTPAHNKNKGYTMKIKPSLFIFITIIAFVFNCGKSDETYTVEMKDGVKYVHNHAPLWGDTLKVTLEFVQRIGVLEGKDENYWFYKPNGVVVDKENNIYILDEGNFRIQKFDKNGKYLSTIGRRGQGPGEFESPLSLQMDSEENLYVGDYRKKCVLVLTKDGKEIKRIMLHANLDHFRLTQEGNIIIPTPTGKILQSEDIAKDIRLISLYDMDGNFIREFGEFKDYGNNDITFDGNRFELNLDKHDNIYVAFVAQNKIEKYSYEGNLIFRADRPLNYKVKIEMKTITYPPELGGATITTPSFSRVSKEICIDHKNRIWVNTYKKQKEKGDKPVDLFEFEIFNNDGILLGKLPIPKNFDNMRIFQDRLFLFDYNEEMCVYEYKIVEK